MTSAVLSSDIGGTFTDVSLLVDGELTVSKVPSTPPSFAQGAADGMIRATSRAGTRPHDVQTILHATTVATNAILENRGARTGLLTTDGFRDVLQLRRARSPDLYNLFYRPPAPLVPRHLRLGIHERIGSAGEVLVPFDRSDARAALGVLEANGVEAVAICLLHSYRNPIHERALADLVRSVLPRTYVSVSSEILPEIGEYERTSTTVINAYLGPIVGRYLTAMAKDLRSADLVAPIFVMQSNGALMGLAAAASRPAAMVESGPAAGVIGTLRLAADVGIGNAIAFDMGGTTTKAGLIEGGRPLVTTEYEVGSSMSQGTGHASGRGHALRLPVLDIAEIGAGGGSIIRVDPTGRIEVGPRSAGAVPGPACYGQGGDEATLTDVLVVMGHINAHQLAGGVVKLRPDLAAAAVHERVAVPLGLPDEVAADGVLRVAVAETARAVKHVTTFRGRRPGDFTLVAYGGNGPVIAAALAEELEIPTVVIPPAAGVFSSFGLLQADEAHHFQRPALAPADRRSSEAADIALVELEKAAAAFIRDQPGDSGAWILGREADLRYREQRGLIRVDVPARRGSSRWLESLAEHFAVEHERTYGYRAPVGDVELVNVRLVATRPRSSGSSARRVKASGTASGPSSRALYFGPRWGWMATPVRPRAAFGRSMEGPCVVDEYDSTVVVPPGWRATLDRVGNVVLGVGGRR